ncbi:MAG: outer membrane protein [Nitrospinota bacterium]
MKRTIASVVLLGSVVSFPVSSYAEFYLSAYVGGAIPNDSDIMSSTGAKGQLAFNSGVAVGGKAGYWFDILNIPYLGLELDINSQFPDADEFSDDATGVTSDVSSDVTVYSFSGNVLGRFPVDEGVNLYAGVGAGEGFADYDDGTITTAGKKTSFRGANDNNFGWQILAGVDWLVLPNLSVFGEYKYTRANNFEFDRGLVRDADYAVNQVYAGVSYKIGKGR